MRAQRAATSVGREQAPQPTFARQIWRVFEYRRPPVPVRPRFTT